MNVNVEIGTPEFLILCGTTLLIQSSFAIGLTLLIMGICSSIVRSSIRINAIQEQAKARQELLAKVNSAGEDVGEALGSLFTALTTPKKHDGTVH